MSEETNLEFTVYGHNIEYFANKAGTFETINVNGECVHNMSGHVGPWLSFDWKELSFLSGAAKETKRVALIKQYVMDVLLTNMSAS